MAINLMLKNELVQAGARVFGGLVIVGGVILLILAPTVGDAVFGSLWSVEPFSYVGTILLAAGLAIVVVSHAVANFLERRYQRAIRSASPEAPIEERWSQVTQRYFELFDHDISRPLRRILGKERELRAVIRSTGTVNEPEVTELLDEIERQAPSFRLMISNIRVLVQLEAPEAQARREPVEPSQIVRRIIERYTAVAAESNKEITWWSEPAEFGIVNCDSSAIEHIVVNLVDNAVRHASNHVEIKLSKNPSHFFIRVWDDGPGISPSYLPHIFGHGWTPEVARREEKSSSGLGLFIARTLAKVSGGDLTVESIGEPDAQHRTEFLLGLPLEGSPETL